MGRLPTGGNRHHLPIDELGGLMNPRDFSALSWKLASKDDCSSLELRTAISRAYYGAYNVAAEFLKKIGVKHAGGADAHRLIPEALRQSRDIQIDSAVADLDGLRKMRWSADYDMEARDVEDHRTIRKFTARAKQIIKKLDE